MILEERWLHRGAKTEQRGGMITQSCLKAHPRLFQSIIEAEGGQHPANAPLDDGSCNRLAHPLAIEPSHGRSLHKFEP